MLTPDPNITIENDTRTAVQQIRFIGGPRNGATETLGTLKAGDEVEFHAAGAIARYRADGAGQAIYITK